MRSNLARSAFVMVLAGAIAALAGTAQARGPGGFNNGPIIINGPIDCEREKVYVCKWVGKFRVCGWVDGPCRVY